MTENITAWTKQDAAGPNVVQPDANTSVSKAGSASASLSLTLEIDPSFPDASKYHLVLSKGVGPQNLHTGRPGASDPGRSSEAIEYTLPIY
jgi:hypothetical protein